MSCPVYKEICREHGFTHGCEAEELRKGIEVVMEDLDTDDVTRHTLQRLLDKVDARDSLAYLEAKDG